MSFRDKIVEIFTNHGLGLKSTEDLFGEDRELAEENNQGLIELWDEIIAIHEEDSAAEALSMTKKRKRGHVEDQKPEPKKRRSRGPTGYSIFTGAVIKANDKGEVDGWDQVFVRVSDLDLNGLAGTEQSMLSLLESAQQMLRTADGYVDSMKLTSMLWTATGKINPFLDNHT
jgi:hypothetical protein